MTGNQDVVVRSGAPGRDFVAGCMIAVIGAAMIFLARRYDWGEMAAPGPGLFPRLLGGALVVLGGLIALRGLAAHRWREKPNIVVLRPFLAIAAIVGFGATIDTLGFVVAAAILIALAVAASERPDYRDIPWLAVCIIPAAILVFIVGLKLLIPIFPKWLI